MHFNIPLALFGTFAVASALVPGSQNIKRAGCAQDNCYNAFTHSLTIASPFCSTYIRSTTTVTVTAAGAATSAALTTFAPVVTNAQLSSRCSQSPNVVPSTALSLRLSSACSCINVVPNTVTVTVTTTASAPSAPSDCVNIGRPYQVAGTIGVYDITCGQVLGSCVPIVNAIPAADTSFQPQNCANACDPNVCSGANYVYDPNSQTYQCTPCSQARGSSSSIYGDFLIFDGY